MNFQLFTILWNKIGKTVGIVFLVGLALTLLVEVIKSGISLKAFGDAVLHIGMAFMIAGVVGICVEWTEFEKLVEDRIVGILFGDEYSDILSDNDLKDMNIKAMNAIGKKCVSNPDYEYHDFTRTIGRDILARIGDIYRKGFTNLIHLHRLTREEKVGLSADALNREDMVRISSITKYYLVVPQTQDEHEFTLDFSYKCFGPNELLRQFKFEVFVNDVELNETHGKKPTSQYLKINEESLEFKFELTLKSELLLKNDGNDEDRSTVGFEPAIEYRRVSYEYDPGSLNSYMGELTHQINVTFSGEEANIEFFGFPSNRVPTRIGNVVSVNYPDWGLAQDGYFISWQRRKPQLS